MHGGEAEARCAAAVARLEHALGIFLSDPAPVIAHDHAQAAEAHVGAHHDTQRLIGLAVLDRVLDERLHEKRRHHHLVGRGADAAVDHEVVAEARLLELEVRLDVPHLIGERDELRRLAQRGAAVLRKRRDQMPRLVRLRADKRRDRVERVEQEVRLDLRLQRGELGGGAGARVHFDLTRGERIRDEAAQRLHDRALLVGDLERALRERDDRADRAATHDQRTHDGRAQRARRGAAMAPAGRQARDALLIHCLHRSGRCCCPRAVMVCREANVREHLAAI